MGMENRRCQRRRVVRVSFELRVRLFVTAKRSLSGRHTDFSSEEICHSKYTQLLATSFNNKLAAAHRQCLMSGGKFS